jgi:SNF2 family DNA or RNA helicase
MNSSYINTTYKKYIDHSGLDFKQYQYDGVVWCVNNEKEKGKEKGNGNSSQNFGNSSQNFGGGFIVDEMGLGKTITMIGTFLCNIVKRTLIILPPVLIDQWYTQIYKTTGHKAIVYYGQKKKNIDLMGIGFCIVITSYSHIAFCKKRKKKKNGQENGGQENGLEEGDGLNDIHRVQWDRIIFDEGHHLRNRKTNLYKGALHLKARIKWVVSGTPIQNSKSDFYNLCRIIGYGRNFDKVPILKRTKKEVGILIPDMIVNLQSISWKNKNEMKMSSCIHGIIGKGAGIVKGVGEDSNSININYWLYERFQSGVLPLYLRARQMCIYPKLVKKIIKEMVSDKIITQEEYSDIMKYSSKMDSVIETVLKNKDNGNGKIIFCSFKAEIDDIATRLRDNGIQQVVTFDGRNSAGSRKTILCDRNDVLILQIQTGCEGLNLQEHYSEIYFVSPFWNPAVEDQAVARCHRIGQKKEVMVYRFEMGGFKDDKLLVADPDSNKVEGLSDSMDNYINCIQQHKRVIASEIIA